MVGDPLPLEPCAQKCLLLYRHDGLTFEDGAMWQENFCSGDDTEGSILPSDYKRLLDGSGFECLDFQYQPQCFRVPPNTIDIYLTKKVLRAYADDFSTHNCFEQFSFEFKSRVFKITIWNGSDLLRT